MAHVFNARRISQLAFCLLVGALVALLGCSKESSRVPLVKSDFTLKLPYGDETTPFGKIKILRTDGRGNLYALDSEKEFIFKFDPQGNFLKILGGSGNQCGQIKYASSMDVCGDSLLIVQTRGVLDFLNLEGECLKRSLSTGFSDVSISPNGTIVLNRMNSALDFVFFIETQPISGGDGTKFGPPRGLQYKDRNADFAFTGFTSDNHLVYVPAFLDSIYIYDLNGKILKSARRAIPPTLPPTTDGPLNLMVEDVCVVNDRIFVLRVDEQESTDEYIYTRLIAEYDTDLRFQKLYELPEPITMSIEMIGAAPWYHKFLVKDNLFIFMVSKPFEHLVAYTPKDGIL